MEDSYTLSNNEIPSFGRITPFTLLILYLVMEYGRPQSLIPFLNKLHLPAIIIFILLISLLKSGGIDISNRQSRLFILIIGLMTLHGPFATNNYWALMVWKSMVLYFIVFLSMVRFVDSREKFYRVMNYWLAIHIFLAIVGVIKGGKGIGGFLGDENDLCMTINMVIPYSFFMAMSARDGRNKMFLFGLTGFFIFTNILTYSRGGFVGLVAVGLYIWCRSPRKLITSFLIGVLVIFTLIIAPKKYWNEVDSIIEEGTKKGTGYERIYTWEVGWVMFLDNPFFGVGQGNFPWDFRKYELERHRKGLETRSLAGRQAHSIYFTLICELGVAGALMFLLLIIQFYKNILTVRSIRNRGDPGETMSFEDERAVYLSYAMEGSLIGYLVSGAFISILYYPNLWLLVAFGYTLSMIVTSSTKIIDGSSNSL